MLTKALGEVPGVKVEGAIKPVKLEAQRVTINLDTAKSDVGDVAKAIAASKTPHKDQVEPEAALVLSLKKVKKSDADTVKKALADVKGVVSQASGAGDGEVIVQLANQGGAHLAEIRKALKKFE